MAKLAGSPDRCGVAILGSTGTIGRNTLDVIRLIRMLSTLGGGLIFLRSDLSYSLQLLTR
ncbi:MAG: hypothetical protein CL393_07515 [Acidiferrobacteraceae bacterium]|nr:hypothetical protein [Acidiferrobacteraceae bacterium]